MGKSWPRDSRYYLSDEGTIEGPRGRLYGGLKKDGYRRVRIGGKDYFYHRFAMECCMGRKLLREEVIDHIDGNCDNNDISNLRITTRALNAFNKEKKIKGWCINPRNKKNPYQAIMRVGGKLTHIGNYPTAAEASRAYLERRKALHPGADEMDKGRERD